MDDRTHTTEGLSIEELLATFNADLRFSWIEPLGWQGVGNAYRVCYTREDGSPGSVRVLRIEAETAPIGELRRLLQGDAPRFLFERAGTLHLLYEDAWI